MKRNIVALVLVGLSILSELNARFIFFDNSSILDLGNGTTLDILTGPTLKRVNGMIRRRPAGTITGNPIFFDDGVLADGVFQIGYTGTYDPALTATLQMVSPSRMNTIIPGKIPYNVHVTGLDNSMEGVPMFVDRNAITFDTASDALTIAILTQLNTSPLLASTINLGADIVLGDFATINGSGTVNFNNFNVITGKKDLVWTSTLVLTDASNFELSSNSLITGRWTLDGVCRFEGNGHVLRLGSTGQILLRPGASLLLNNIVIEGVDGNKIGCMDCSGTLSFGNVLWKQDADFTFTNGAFDVLGLWELVGTSTFIFSPCRTCNIKSQGTMRLNEEMTFFYNPTIDNRDLLAFQDSSAVVELQGATIASTFTGMRFTNGTLIAESHCFLTQNTSVIGALSESIAIGNGIPANEMTVIIGPSATLELLAGQLFYDQAE